MGVFHITQEEWRRQVERVARIDQNMENIGSSVLRIEDTLKDRLGDHSKRIRSLERWRSYWTGACTVLGLVAGVILAKLKDWL